MILQKLCDGSYIVNHSSAGVELGMLAGPGYSMLLGAEMGRDHQGKGIILEMIEFLCKVRVYSGAKPGVVPEVGVKGVHSKHC